MDEQNTQYQDSTAILSRIVKVGVVDSVDNVKRLAKIKFQDSGMISDWLSVLINRDYIPDYDVPQRTESESGGSGDAAFENHKHDLIIKPWMPKVGDHVVALYLPTRNADGFIVGEYIPWQ